MNNQFFHEFVLSSCNPSHVRSARKGVNDWVPFENEPNVFISPSTGQVHHCDPNTCGSWILRFVDGVKICAISGKLILKGNTPSSRKRVSNDLDQIKRHQDKPIQGSSAYLTEKFNLDDHLGVEMDVESVAIPSNVSYRLNQYPYI